VCISNILQVFDFAHIKR